MSRDPGPEPDPPYEPDVPDDERDYGDDASSPDGWRYAADEPEPDVRE